MTKEKLEQDAIQFAKYYSTVFCVDAFPVYKAFLKVAEPREKQITELEKENERLTDELKNLRESIKDYGAGCYENGLRNGKRKLDDQLTKAKELLERFLGLGNLWDLDCKDYFPLRKEAEQFLSEVEK
jgi:chaperonin cofactor prefoldin